MKKTAFLALFLVAVAGFSAPSMAGHFVVGQGGKAVFTGQISPNVQALLAEYPNGGKGLEDAVRKLLVTNPELADDVVEAANSANAAQRSAFAKGFAIAVKVLQATPGSSASVLTQASTYFTPVMQSLYTAALAVATANQSGNGSQQQRVVAIPGISQPVSAR